jgi:outer membrane receptor protein involved in Fe transport
MTFAKALVRSAIISLVLTLPVAAQAQQRGSSITGRITEVTSGIPVAGATVSIEGSSLRAVTDDTGRFQLTNVPPGPQVIRVVRIGYAPLRHQLVVPPEGTVSLELAIARNALQLPGLVVTADPSSRAQGELGTASVIGQDAIKNQTAASLSGVLELVPGTLLQPPGLDGVQQFGLRAVPIGPGSAPGAGSVSGPTASLLASFGTQIVLDGVPVSNNVNLQSLGPRGELTFATAAGGGIDLRRIPAATIERVEVIRGLPSARFGDMTQGAVLVETRAGAIDPESRVRLDARTVEATLIGGRRLSSRSTGSASLNLARTRLAPGFRDDIGSRITGQLAHRYEGARLTLDTRLDGYQVLEDEPATAQLPDLAARSRDMGFRLSERLRWRLGERTRIDWTAALEGIRQRSFTESPLLRGAMPFTNRLTEGTQDGKFIGGTYVARVDVDGDPRHFYSRLEAARGDLRAGLELRREWNGGPGYIFDIEFPPQVNFNGVNGYDRPRRFDLIPPLVTSALYVDDRLSRTFGNGWILNVQAGTRLDLLHWGSHWLRAARDYLVQPRLQLELQPAARFRLRAGAGRLAKMPALGDLFPAPQYYDLVNFNWYANDPAERRAILTTRILQRQNPNLAMSRADKAELGAEWDLGGGGQLALVGYLDRVRGAIGIDLTPQFLIRDRYAVDSSTINQGHPPSVLQPPIASDTVPVLIDRPDNNLDLRSRGFELTAILPEIAPLRTRVAVLAAWTHSRLASQGLDFGVGFDDFQLNERVPRAPYWQSVVETGERLLVTTRLIHHQPKIGLIITATVQLFVRELRANEGGTDTLAFAGYITRAGVLVPVPVSQRVDSQYHDLRIPRLGVLNNPQEAPVDWLLGLQVSKSLPLDGRLSFYAFNAFDRIGSYGGRTTAPRLFPAARFGLEVTMPLGLAWGEH